MEIVECSVVTTNICALTLDASEHFLQTAVPTY